MQIAVLVGSLRKDSYNRRLVNALKKLAPADFTFTDIRIDDLPHYDQDDDASQADAVKRIKAEIAGADALLFATPEYNRSVSGVLKNAIDHGSRPYGESIWAGKPAGVIGASIGAIGTALAQQHLRTILSALDVAVLPQPDAYIQISDATFDADGNISETSRDFFQNWMDRYANWVRKLAQ